jgi:metal-dependent amidase/aminoacylase/carboxypeptidase family protein
VHASSSYSVTRGSVGCITKAINYKGVASHAGGSPQNGRNALYAATCGLNAVNAIRETFVEADRIRVHPIITSGGAMVNAIPSDVKLESYVRGNTFEAIANANKKVNRALVGAAISLGTNIEIVDAPGYSPLINSEEMIKVAAEAADMAIPEENIRVTDYISTGCTDMGDLSCIMPTVQPHCGGATGRAHGNDYRISDPLQACEESALWQLTMLFLLLEKDGARAKKILEDFRPQYTKEEFLALQDSLNDRGDRIEYSEEGARIRL